MKTQEKALRCENYASLPPSQINEMAQDIIGRELTDDEMGEFYCIIESELNNAIDIVVTEGMEEFKDRLKNNP